MAEFLTLVDLLSSLGASDRRVVFPESGFELPHRALPDLARAFGQRLSRCGVAPGDVVGILIPTSPQWLPAFFGIQVAGAVGSALPLPPALLDSAARHLSPLVAAGRMRHIAAAGPGLAVAAELAASFPDLTVVDASRAHLRRAGTIPDATEVVPPHPSAAAIVQFSSGSTARPKGVLLSHASALAGVSAINRHIRTVPADVLVQWVPLFHDMGLVALLCSLLTPCDAHLFGTSTFIRSPERVLAHIADANGSIVTGPNFSYDRFVAAAAKSGLTGPALRSWRLALNGAEPVRPETLAAFERTFRPLGVPASTMYPCYGMAEATLAVTMPRLGATPRCLTMDCGTAAIGNPVKIVDAGTPGGRTLASVGIPVPDMALRIEHTDGTPLAEGHLGEVCIRGTSLFAGYLHDPETTGAARPAGWLHTGDLGFIHDGELYLVGRGKEMIVVHGRNFFPEDVENAVRSLSGIYRGRCLAVARQDAESIVLVAESTAGADGGGPALSSAIRSAISAELGLSAIEVVLVPPRTLPRTTSGKWQRSLVRGMVNKYDGSTADPDDRI